MDAVPTEQATETDHAPDSRSGGTERTATSADPLTVVFFDGSAASYGGGSEMIVRLLTRIDTEAFDPVLLSQHRDELCRRLADAVSIEIVPYPGSLDQYDGKILDQPRYRTVGTGLRVLQYNLHARNVLGRADVLWCVNLRSLLTIGPYVATSSMPVIWNVGLGHPSEGVFRHLNGLGLRVADHVFIESEHQARRLFTEEQYAEHADGFRIFAKGIDTGRFAPGRSEPPLAGKHQTIGTAASLTPRKGVEYFVEAAIDLLDERDDLEFQIAGEPPHEADVEYGDRLRSRVEAAGHGDAIHFLGWVEEMPRFYDGLDAFVLPSRNEGVPGVVREALSMELPAVATDVGGTREVVRDGRTGLLIDPEAPEEIVEAVRSLVANPEAARAMASAGRELVERRFSVDAYVENYEAFLEEVGR